MSTYSTSQVAKKYGIHSNTVRLYEEWGLIPKAKRKSNGYRVFTDFHMDQLRLVRTGFQIELVHSGLRKKMIEALTASATKDFDQTLFLMKEYLDQIETEIQVAKEAIQVANDILSGDSVTSPMALGRKETSSLLDITMETMRNWERNGLLTISRKENGYRIYAGDDINRLKMIKALRHANYSLEAILRMLNALSKDEKTNIEYALNTPHPDTDIISVCDQLILSLQTARKNSVAMIDLLSSMKETYSN